MTRRAGQLAAAPTSRFDSSEPFGVAVTRCASTCSCAMPWPIGLSQVRFLILVGLAHSVDADGAVLIDWLAAGPGAGEVTDPHRRSPSLVHASAILAMPRTGLGTHQLRSRIARRCDEPCNSRDARVR